MMFTPAAQRRIERDNNGYRVEDPYERFISYRFSYCACGAPISSDRCNVCGVQTEDKAMNQYEWMGRRLREWIAVAERYANDEGIKQPVAEAFRKRAELLKQALDVPVEGIAREAAPF